MARPRLPGEARPRSRRGPSPSESRVSAKLYLESKLGEKVATSLLATGAREAATPPRFSISADKARRVLKLASDLLPLILELKNTHEGRLWAEVNMLVPCLAALPDLLEAPSGNSPQEKALRTLSGTERQTRFAFDVLAYLRYVDWRGDTQKFELPKYKDLTPTRLMALAVALGVEDETGSADRDAAMVEERRCLDRWIKAHQLAERLAETLLPLTGPPPPEDPVEMTRACGNALRRALGPLRAR